jgi:uncharacterized membrane protein
MNHSHTLRSIAAARFSVRRIAAAGFSVRRIAPAFSVRRIAATCVAVIASVAAAAAQVPQFTDMPVGSPASDVTFANNEAVVVGADNVSVFRWTAATGKVPLGASSVGGNVSVSNDGLRVATTINTSGTSRAAYWSGGTWTEATGLGGTSGTSETSCYDISGDGQTLVGLGWIVGGSAHCFSWTAAGGAVDHGGPFSDPSSRANAVNGNGTVIVGWKNNLANQRQATRWVNGTLGHLTYVNASQVTFQLGEALAVNASGNVIVGTTVYGGDNSAWRWDASTGNATLLPNLPGETTYAVATDVSDDGQIVVGHSGGNAINGTIGIVWINGQPHRLIDYLNSLGVQGMSPAYTDLGIVSAISGDGNVIVGTGTGFGLGQAASGWVVELHGALHTGTSFCSGDGTGTACPCGNVGISGQGCASSVNTLGAVLGAQGLASVSGDTVVLQGSGMPNSSALYFQGTTQVANGAGSLFGDGLRCAGGSIVRLKAVTNSSGASQYPNAGDPSVSTKGAVTPGTRTYQVWYRNAAAFCTPSTFNLTNGLSILWVS